MTSDVEVPNTADGVRRLNAGLDEQILAELDGIDHAVLHAAPAAGEWSLAQIAAHLAEFPLFFADDLRRWCDDPTTVVGRTHDHAARLAAVDDPEGSVEMLWAAAARAFGVLAAALASLRDEDLVARTINARYGEEPMARFLARYVIGHKQEHLDQIRSTKAAVTT